MGHLGPILKTLFWRDPARPAQHQLRLGREGVGPGIKAVAHNHRRKGQGVIGGLGTRMKGQTVRTPVAHRRDHRIHGLRHRSHAHQVGDGGVDVGGEPEGKPVVGQVEQNIKALPLGQGTVPEPGQQAIGWNLHGCGAGPMLPAGLAHSRGGDQLRTGAGRREDRALRRQHAHPMTPAEQAGHQAHGRDLHPTPAAAAEGPHRGAHHQHPHAQTPPEEISACRIPWGRGRRRDA